MENVNKYNIQKKSLLIKIGRVILQNNKHSCDKMYKSIDCDTILLLNSYKHPLIKSNQVEGHIYFF